MSMRSILFVDDEPDVLESFERRLYKNFNIITARSGATALQKIKQLPDLCVVISDMRMPEMDGITFLKAVKDLRPQLVRIMLTGNTDQDTAIKAVNDGEIFRFLTKPCGSQQLTDVLNEACNIYDSKRIEKEVLNTTVKGVVRVLCEIMELSEPELWKRGVQSMRLVKAIGAHFPKVDLWELEMAAVLSRIGCMVLPIETRIRYAAYGALNHREKVGVNRIPWHGYDLLRKIPRLHGIAKIVLCQGLGPDDIGIRERKVGIESLPFSARILKVCFEYFDYKQAGLADFEVVEKICTDSSNDPEVIKVFRTTIENMHTITDELRDYKGEIFELKVEEVTADYICFDNVVTKDGKLVYDARTVLTDLRIERLKSYHGIYGIKEPLRLIK
jgi:CheY-like chemotaxis protein